MDEQTPCQHYHNKYYSFRRSALKYKRTHNILEGQISPVFSCAWFKGCIAYLVEQIGNVELKRNSPCTQLSVRIPLMLSMAFFFFTTAISIPVGLICCLEMFFA